MSYAAYANTQNATETPRDLEFRAISHVTRRLGEANTPDGDPMARIRALNGNTQMWSLLVADLSGPANMLPDTIKAGYISLGWYARRASLAAMSNKADLSTLISINTDVLEALERQRAKAA